MTPADPDHDARPTQILGRASIAAAGAAYQQGLTFITGLLIARVIGAADYGVFNLARRLLDVTTILTRMGLDIGLQRHFGEARAGADAGSAQVVLQRVRLVAAGVALLPVLAVTLGLGRVLEDRVYQYPDFANVLLVLSLSLPFMTDLAILSGAYRGTLKLAPSVLAMNVLLPTVRLLSVVVLFMLGWRLWAVVAATVAASLVAAAALALRARIDFAPKARPADYRWREATGVIRYSGILAIGVAVGTLMSNMDVIVLGRHVDAESLGQYSLAKTLLLIMGIFGLAFSQGLGSLVAERFRRNDIEAMVSVMALTMRWIVLGTLPLFAIFLLWGARITALFGPSFAIDQPVVAWLALGQFLFSVFSISGWALSMTGKQGVEVRVLGLGMLTAAGLCGLLIPAYGQLGAAFATCASIATANTARLYFVRRHIGRLPVDPGVVTITGLGLGVALLCDLVVAELALSPARATAACIGLYLPAYAGAAWLALLRDPEKQGIRRVVKSTANLLFCRAGT